MSSPDSRTLPACCRVISPRKRAIFIRFEPVAKRGKPGKPSRLMAVVLFFRLVTDEGYLVDKHDLAGRGIRKDAPFMNYCARNLLAALVGALLFASQAGAQPPWLDHPVAQPYTD